MDLTGLFGLLCLASAQGCVGCAANNAGTGGGSAGNAGAGVTGTGGVAPGGSGGAIGTGTGGATGIGGATTAGSGGRAGSGGAVGMGGVGTLGGSGGSPGQAGANGLTACTGAAYNPASPPATLTLSGNLGAHDPAAFVVGSTIYLAATGLTAKTSTNLTAWQTAPSPLPLPAWARTATSATNVWAPDISFFGGMYHLYYAASTFGSNKSCIGHATRAALDAGSWVDSGTATICSNMGTTDNWNAIDPNVVIDDAGTPWLAFGSFWSGLKMIKLDSTGIRADTMLYSIANGANSRGSLEGSWVFKNCGYYYLFSSWGSCCTSPYDYNMRVGRSTTVTGPYLDKAGVDLMAGGGTLLVQGNTAWVAPGHNAVISYGGKTYNIYHALAGGNGATLRISELVWDADGWPVSGGP